MLRSDPQLVAQRFSRCIYDNMGKIKEKCNKNFKDLFVFRCLLPPFLIRKPPPIRCNTKICYFFFCGETVSNGYDTKIVAK